MKPLILSRRRLVEVVNAFPPPDDPAAEEGDPAPMPAPGQPDPMQAGGAPPGQPDPKALAAAVKATVKDLDKPGKGNKQPKQEAQDGQDAEGQAQGPDAGGAAGGGAAEGSGGGEGPGQGDAADGGQAALAAGSEEGRLSDDEGTADDAGAEQGGGDSAEEDADAGLEGSAVPQGPDAQAQGGDDAPGGQGGRVTLTPQQIQQEGHKLLASMHSGFHGLLAQHTHALSGTAEEQLEDAEPEGDEGEEQGDGQEAPEDADADGSEPVEEGGEARNPAAEQEAGQVSGGSDSSGQIKPPGKAVTNLRPLPKSDKELAAEFRAKLEARL